MVLMALLLLSAPTIACCSVSSSHYTSGRRSSLRIEDILPSAYDKMAPPKKEGRPTVVYFHVTVMSIDSVNENSMDYSQDVQFFTENTVSSFTLTDDLDWLHHLWRPDSFFKNAKEVNFQTMTVPNHYVWLYKDFTILYMVKLTLTLSCAMNFLLYPHDTQECKLQMESLSHTTQDLVFAWEENLPLAVDDTIELPQQMIVSNITSDCTQVYSTGNFTCLEVIFKLKRHLGHYLFHTYIPTCLIVIMSWISFWIRPDIAPARVTLGVTSLLTLSTQHAKSQAALPPVSYIKAIDIFMSSCTVFVFMALMEYAVICVILGDESTNTPKSKPSSTNRNSKMSPTNIKGGAYFRTHEPGSIFNPATKAQQRQAQAIMVDRGSRYIFPISFSVLNCIYWMAFWAYL
ncbi:Glycine receptor subunit alpha-2-like 6 [Homarus americanus]|uniref:Glycine receptor subunit alpha-2-like 6 n=1 Tax=Homarus americanus TaxID=6706 RepID=A0A8J5JT59_HOMAM|nr:Glycine receptor subunit alpha-2-like 6 [Homarus americanus]